MPTIICLFDVVDTTVAALLLETVVSITEKLFAIFLSFYLICYPNAIANGIADGSASVILTVDGKVTAFVEVFTEKSVKSSEPSNSFIVIVFVTELSNHIVPAAALPGLELPMCPVFNAPKLLFKAVLNVLNAWLSIVICDTWLMFSPYVIT
jgi:hypothetical protein